MKLQINVTKEVIAKARFCPSGSELQNNIIFNKGLKKYEPLEHYIANNCAVALAIKELFPNARVGSTVITIPNERAFKDPEIKLPIIACTFIRLFDELTPGDRLQMPPISFEIDVPDKVINRIGISEATAIIEKSETLAIVE